MTQYQRHKLDQWRRYEFIREYGMENAEENPKACVDEMVKAGLYVNQRGYRGIVAGIVACCRWMREGWKPTPIEATAADVMQLLASKVGAPPTEIKLSPDESALIWSAVQRWKKSHGKP